MNLSSVPMLISGVVCIVLAVTTWLFRKRENINRIFSLFTLALAIDAFVFFAWYQFGGCEHLKIWMRITFTAGFLIPIALIFFFYAFTGYDKKMSEKVLGIKTGHFRNFTLFFIAVCMVLAQFTNLVLDFTKLHNDRLEFDFGPLGLFMFPLYLVIFIYLFSMAITSLRKTTDKPQRRFILLLTLGTCMWLLFGYGGAIFIPFSSDTWQAVSYTGTTVMAIFYFVAIVKYQSDKVHDLNINLERKIKKSTEELRDKNSMLEKTLAELKEVQQQIIVQEKMAIWGQVAAGFTHEINTPVGAIHSMINTRLKAFQKLNSALDDLSTELSGKDLEVRKMMSVITRTDSLIDQSAERLKEITNTLKNFVKLDEAEKQITDIHKGINSSLYLIKHELLNDIKIVQDYDDLPLLLCHPQKLNQVFLNLLINACESINGPGQIKIKTRKNNKNILVSISDTGRGVKPEDFVTIFDPGFTTQNSVIRANLGLSLCYQIVKDHGGSIDVKSQSGKGSVFTINLPINN